MRRRSAVMIMVAPIRAYPQRTVDSADDTASGPADYITNKASDRAKYAMADVAPLMRPFADAPANALSMCREWNSEKGKNACGHH